MKPIETVLIAGSGAVGLTVADTFYRYDPRCIALLAGGKRLDRYRRNGLHINEAKVDFILADPEAAKPAAFDLIIVACKNHHLNQIITDIKPFVGPKTLILSLLNGISSEEILGRSYGRERLPLAIILGADAQRRDNKISFTRRGVVHFGDAEGKAGSRDECIEEFFTRTGLPFEHHREDMKKTLWFKFMVNVGANQTSALLRLPYGAFKQKNQRTIPEAREILESAMREVIPIARAEGISLGEEDIAKWLSAVELLDDQGYTSMCQDVLAGRKTEVELFGLTVVEYGKKHRISTPVNELLYRALRVIERG
jgi:2-dehydropantoate 2-reductase